MLLLNISLLAYALNKHRPWHQKNPQQRHIQAHLNPQLEIYAL